MTLGAAGVAGRLPSGNGTEGPPPACGSGQGTWTHPVLPASQVARGAHSPDRQGCCERGQLPTTSVAGVPWDGHSGHGTLHGRWTGGAACCQLWTSHKNHLPVWLLTGWAANSVEVLRPAAAAMAPGVQVRSPDEVDVQDEAGALLPSQCPGLNGLSWRSGHSGPGLRQVVPLCPSRP